MLRCKPSLQLALCTIIILTAFIGSTQSASCCLRYSNHRFQCSRLLGYTLQTINTSCDINAVIFHLPDRFVCSNPNKRFTIQAMKCVDGKKWREQNNMKQNTNSSHPAA